MRGYKKFLTSFLVVVAMTAIPVISLAEKTMTSSNQHSPEVLLKCDPTPEIKIKDGTYPGKKINRSNNLRRKSGSPWVAEGNSIIINGRILSAKCLPVVGALVEIWHADNDGNLHLPNGNNGITADKHFLGSGSTYSDNNGEYRFVSIMPGHENETSAPFVNIRVSHRSLKEPFETRIYFAGNERNDDDLVLFTYSAEDKELLLAIPQDEPDTNNQTHIFNVMLKNFKNKFLGY